MSPIDGPMTYDALLRLLRDWVGRTEPRLSSLGVQLALSSNDEGEKKSCWIEAEGSARLGQLTVWSTGEVDLQVMRRNDSTLVVNEHRTAVGGEDLDLVLRLLEIAVSYADPVT